MIDTAPMNEERWRIIMKPIDKRAEGLKLNVETILAMCKLMDEWKAGKNCK